MEIVVSVSLLLGFMPTNKSPWTMFMLLMYDAFDIMLNCPLDDMTFSMLGKGKVMIARQGFDVNIRSNHRSLHVLKLICVRPVAANRCDFISVVGVVEVHDEV